ncbi:MAG: desulfoferrodoxin [Clostridia bacterium]|nr:desulfoferrodoxin [Clostridia bacterium]
MAENTRFYVCPICGNVIGLIDGDANHIMCCGKPMVPLAANTVDAAHEKHVPVIERSEDEIVVKVGEVTHPMEKEHFITWVAEVSDNRTTRVRLYPEQDPVVRFKYIPGATIYAYCNKHGLWSKKVD